METKQDIEKNSCKFKTLTFIRANKTMANKKIKNHKGTVWFKLISGNQGFDLWKTSPVQNIVS